MVEGVVGGTTVTSQLADPAIRRAALNRVIIYTVLIIGADSRDPAVSLYGQCLVDEPDRSNRGAGSSWHAAVEQLYRGLA